LPCTIAELLTDAAALVAVDGRHVRELRLEAFILLRRLLQRLASARAHPRIQPNEALGCEGNVAREIVYESL